MDTQAKNIAAWTPVVAEILQGFVRFDDKAVRTFPILSFSKLIPFQSLQDICQPSIH